MFITRCNYNYELKRQSNKNEKLNDEFLKLYNKLKSYNLVSDKLNFITVGNSVSAGYSKCDQIKPLFMRNKLYYITKDIEYYSFSRVRHNQDSSVLEWYLKNKSQGEITKLLIDDIMKKQYVYNRIYWNKKVVASYEKMFNKKIGLKDLITDPSQTTIIIYNGLTGVFTDIFRNASMLRDYDKLFICFKEDLKFAEALCRQIYLDNPNVQIYFCGIPNIMGISDICNKNIKKLSRELPNVTYVSSPVKNIYGYIKGQTIFDIHYNRPEYLILLNRIIKGILDNYIQNMVKCDVLNNLRIYHLEIESICANAIGDIEKVSKILKDIREKYKPLSRLEIKSLCMAIEDVKKYFEKNYFPMFYCIPREETLNVINSWLDL